MKKLIIALIATLGIFTADTAQAGERYVQTLVKSNGNNSNTHTVYTVPADKYVKIYSFQNAIGSYSYVKTNISGEEIDIAQSNVQGAWFRDLRNPYIIVGPAVITATFSHVSQHLLTTYQVLPNLAE